MEQTDFVVDALVESFCKDGDERSKFLFRHTLVNLVKMAKAEKAAEFQRDVEFVTQVMVSARPDDNDASDRSQNLH